MDYHTETNSIETGFRPGLFGKRMGLRVVQSIWVLTVLPITKAVPMVMDSKFTQANSKINSVGLNVRYVPLVTLWST